MFQRSVLNRDQTAAVAKALSSVPLPKMISKDAAARIATVAWAYFNDMEEHGANWYGPGRVVRFDGPGATTWSRKPTKAQQAAVAADLDRRAQEILRIAHQLTAVSAGERVPDLDSAYVYAMAAARKLQNRARGLKRGRGDHSTGAIDFFVDCALIWRVDTKKWPVVTTKPVQLGLKETQQPTAPLFAFISDLAKAFGRPQGTRGLSGETFLKGVRYARRRYAAERPRLVKAEDALRKLFDPVALEERARQATARAEAERRQES